MRRDGARDGDTGAAVAAEAADDILAEDGQTLLAEDGQALEVEE